MYDRKKTVKLLLKKDANFNIHDDDLCTSLDAAFREIHKEIAQMLLKSEINIDSNDRDSETLLSSTFQQDYENVIQTLLNPQYGPKDDPQRIELATACAVGNEDIFEREIQH